MSGPGRTTWVYIHALAAAAIVMVGALALRHPLHPGLPLLLFGVPAVLAGPRAIRLGGRVEMLVTQPFLFATLIAAGVTESILAATLCALAFSLIRSRPLPAHRVLFNCASLTITQAAAAIAYLLAGGPLRDGLTPAETAPGLMLAALVFFLANSLTVSAVVALSERKSVIDVWRRKFLWSFPTPFAAASLAFGMAAALQHIGPWALVLAAPPTLLIYYSYRLYRERQEEHRRRLEEVRRMNAELEAKVRERTAELRQVNGELADSNRKLEKASRMKSEFLATMSHELRTPLNAIIGFSELLLDPRMCELDEEPAEYARDILGSGRHLLDMINDILDLSKVEAGRMDLHLEETDLRVAAQEALSMIVPMAGSKGLKLETAAGEEELMVRADPVKLRQMLYNLLSNAAKFTPEGGTIRVSWEVHGSDVEIAVSDTGIGIAPEQQERIFQEFMQVDSSLGRRYTGTGLGLSLVKKFAEMHGGSVEVHSTAGEGATFRIVLRGALVREPGPAAPVRAAARAPTPLTSGRWSILVVEDNEMNRKLVCKLLSAAGHDVRQAICARRGIESARAEPPDLILMDLQLPDMSGLEATRVLAGDARTRSVPVVALSAHVEEGDEERVREAGCVGFLRKPIDTAEFPVRIQEHLERAGALATAGGGG